MKTIKQKLNDIFFKREKEKLLNPNKFIKISKFEKFLTVGFDFSLITLVSSILNLVPLCFIENRIQKNVFSESFGLFLMLSSLILTTSLLYSVFLWFRKKYEKKLRRKIEDGDFDYLEKKLFSGEENIQILNVNYSIIYDSTDFYKLMKSAVMNKKDIDNFKIELLKEFDYDEIKKALSSKELNDEFKDNNGFSYFYFYKLLKILKENKNNKEEFNLQCEILLPNNDILNIKQEECVKNI